MHGIWLTLARPANGDCTPQPLHWRCPQKPFCATDSNLQCRLSPGCTTAPNGPRGLPRVQILCNDNAKLSYESVEWERHVSVQITLRTDHVHREWAANYRGTQNELFARVSFDWILARLSLQAGATVLDAGCGNARHSLRLARTGLKVTAVDFSDFAAQDARARVSASDVAGLITVEQADLTRLSLADARFDAVFCMGVLMHIPDIEAALTHVVRVVKPGGFLVLSETSMYGFDQLLRRFVYRVRPSPRLKILRARGALDMWSETTVGPLLTRTHHIPQLVQRLNEHGMTLVERRAGEFTEFYRRINAQWANRAVHAFNRLWFRWIGFAPMATGQLLLFRKR